VDAKDFVTLVLGVLAVSVLVTTTALAITERPCKLEAGVEAHDFVERLNEACSTGKPVDMGDRLFIVCRRGIEI
jgi:hypothetical protein